MQPCEAGGEHEIVAGEKRPAAKNHHPTVKPLALMEWLVKLVTPPGGLVLDPFTGSGSTGAAAVRTGHRFVGIEREPEYLQVAAARIGHYLPR
jgi:site-specific DNA-methyltransferase (adenine-specific)